VCAGHEAGVPALLFVELPEHHEQFIGRGVQPRRQIRDGLTEIFDWPFRFHARW
jgi:hypothetical protein